MDNPGKFSGRGVSLGVLAEKHVDYRSIYRMMRWLFLSLLRYQEMRPHVLACVRIHPDCLPKSLISITDVLPRQFAWGRMRPYVFA